MNAEECADFSKTTQSTHLVLLHILKWKENCFIITLWYMKTVIFAQMYSAKLLASENPGAKNTEFVKPTLSFGRKNSHCYCKAR